MRVFVYKNLHRDCYSVRDESTKRVSLHAVFVYMEDATLSVGKKGRERVLKERRKNVHAGIRGTLMGYGKAVQFGPPEGWVPVTYDPYKYDSFVVKETEAPVSKAEAVWLTPNGVYVKGIS